VIFLDIEYMRSVPQKMRDYYKAWTEAVLKDGRYRPGYYAHTRNAETIHRDVALVYAAAGRMETPPFWVAGGAGFEPEESGPQDVGHHFAAMWQGTLDVVERWRGHSMALDVNVAAVRDPSHQFVVRTDARALPVSD
jgi:GH25 family lysozyme M1 (1,4-beta-N-acetylmuramidase)